MCETPQACRGFDDRADIFWKDNLLRGGGTHYLRKPPEVGRAPVSSARVAEILPEPEGCEPARGRLEVPPGIFAGAAEIAHGFIFHGGHRHRGEIPRAHQTGQVDGVTTVGLHPVAWLFGHERGRHDPAEMALFRQIAREPIPTGSCCIDKDQVWSCGLQLAPELINVDLPGANRAKEGATAMDALWTSMPTESVRDGDMADLRCVVVQVST